jgi:hypothetical protein
MGLDGRMLQFYWVNLKNLVGRSIRGENNIKVDHRELGCEGGSHVELGQDRFVMGFGTTTAMLVMCMCKFEIFTYTPNNFMVIK